MIRFGLRLALASGREAVAGAAIVAVAVALGAGMLLAALAGVNATNAQNARYAWLNTGTAAAEDATADPMWWLQRLDYFHGENISRVDVAATGPDAPVPPGIPRLPGPGEFYASPALGELLRTTPAAELADRYPGHQIGTVGGSALPSPDFLLVIVGHRPGELSTLAGATQVTSIATGDPSRCAGCTTGNGADAIKAMLAIVAAAILFPILIFIGTATRLTATRREQRFAAMRLVGATPRQISVIATAESTVSAAAGTAAGFGLFFLSRPLLAAIPFTGQPFFPGDLSLSVLNILLVAVGIPAGAVVAARLALRRVRISPLGISRRTTPRPPRAWRLVPLVVGIGELAYFADRRPSTTNGQLLAYLSGPVLIMVGLVLAGPWLTLLGSRLLARRARRPAGIIAGRRLSDNPQAGFRAVSGLMVALFVTSVATGAITGFAADRGTPSSNPAYRTSLTKTFWPEERTDGEPGPSVDAVPTELRSIPGVQSVTVVHASPDDRPVAGGDRPLPGLVSCADLARSDGFGSCADGAQVATVYSDLLGPPGVSGRDPVWAAAAVAPERLRELPVLSVVVNTDGSAAAIEEARTVLEVTFPAGRAPFRYGSSADSSLLQWQQLANVVILASLPIAGCSLAVSVAGGLSDRRRPFSMLRLAGVQLSVLRRVVALESVVPLLLAAGLAIGTGFLAAQLFLTSQLDSPLHPPGVGYYVIVAAGLAGAVGIIASTLPLLRRITGPEAARNE